MQFRKKWGVNIDYKRQGLIYFICVNYNIMPEEVKLKILNVCTAAGGEYYQALFELVTTDESVTAVSTKYYISVETLYRALRRFIKQFNDELLSRE